MLGLCRSLRSLTGLLVRFVFFDFRLFQKILIGLTDTILVRSFRDSQFVFLLCLTDRCFRFLKRFLTILQFCLLLQDIIFCNIPCRFRVGKILLCFPAGFICNFDCCLPPFLSGYRNQNLCTRVVLETGQKIFLHSLV